MKEAKSSDSTESSKPPAQRTSPMSKAFGYAFGPVTTGIVDYVDIDGIIQRIDIDTLLDKVDWDALLEKVDMNKVLRKVDMNKLLQAVDLNTLLKKVDVNELVERAEIGAIVARSTAGVIAPLMDGMRSTMVLVDQGVQGVGICRKSGVPQAPRDVRHYKMPKGASNIAVAVQGRYSGTVSRGLAFLADQFIVSGTFTLVVILIQQAMEIFTINKDKSLELKDYPWIIFFAITMWQFVYYTSSLAATGRTLGKALVGLQVVNTDDGQCVKTWRAVVRTIFLPLSVWSVVGVLVGVVRKDRRELHDLLAGTGVVYKWDARFAKYREQKIDEADGPCTDLDVDEMADDSNEKRRFGLFRRRKKNKKLKNESRNYQAAFISEL